MRFIVFGLLFLTTAFVAESRSLVKRDTTQDDLVKEIQQLRDTVRKELDKLKAEGKTVLAKELQMADMALVDLESQARRLQPTTEAGKALLAKVEEAFDKLKKKVEDEIKKLDGGFYAADPIEEALLKQVGDLYEQAKKEIETEAKTKKDEVVNAIEVAEKVVKSIETKVKALAPAGDLEKELIGVAEKLIVKGEDILAAALKNVQSGSALSDNKADFVATVKEVYEKALSVFEELDKKDKATLKTELTKLVDLAKQIQKEVDDAIPQIKIAKPLFEGVQTLVKDIVAFLELKLKSVGGFYASDPIEEALLKNVGDLYEQAKTEIETEAKTKKDEVVSALQTAIKVVKDIDTKVKALAPAGDLEKQLIGVAQKLIVKGEDILAAALKNVQSGSALADNKADFVATVKAVYEKALSVFEELDKKDKATLKTELTKLVDLVKEIQKEVDAAVAQIKIAKPLLEGVQTLVKDVVAFLELKLKSVGGFYEADPLEDTLVKQVGDLYDNAKKAIDTLAKTGKDQLIHGLETSVKFVESLDDKVKALKPTTDLEKSLVDLVETLAKKGAEYLSEALKNVQSGTTTTVDHKPELIALVKKVYEQAKTVFETLEKSDKKTLKDGITKVIAIGKEVQTDLKTLNPTTDIGKAIFQGVTALVDEVVAFLEAQLKTIGGYYAADPIEEALLKQVGDLYDQAKKEIETEAKTKKDEVVSAIQVAEKVVKDIETKVKALAPAGDLEKELIGEAQKLINIGETILSSALKSVQSGSPLDNMKDDFLGNVRNVYEKALSVFEELDKKDKATLKTELTKLVALVKEIQKEVDAGVAQIKIAKPLFEGIQTLVKDVVAFLELKLKSVGGFYASDPIEEALLKNVGDLYEQAKKEIETEAKTKKDEVANAIQVAEKVVKDIETKVKALAPAGDLEKELIGVAEKLIVKGEDILASALKSVQSGSALSDNKADFVATVKEVYEKALSVFEELDKKDKATLKTELTKLVDLAKQIQKEVDDAIPQIKIAKQLFEGVQTLVKDIVAFLELKLKSVGGF